MCITTCTECKRRLASSCDCSNVEKVICLVCSFKRILGDDYKESRLKEVSK